MKSFLVEFIGAFFLVFTIGCAVALNGGSPFAPLAIGIALMIMVYAGGYISGGHYNPAVSMGAALRGALDWKMLIPYWIAQFGGAALAGWLVYAFIHEQNFSDPYNIINMKLITAEFIFTFALVYVVLHTATSRRTSNNSYYGLAIGSTVAAGAIAAGSVCLAAFNPAVALALGIMKIASWSVVFTTLGINFLAGIVAAIAYWLTAPKSEFGDCDE